MDAGKEDGSSAGVGSTVAGSSLASEDHHDEDGDSIIGRWITEEEDFVTFDPPRYPVDMSSFGPGGRGSECLKQDSQKADDAEVPTYMWDHFFADSFLRKFRSHMPEGWRTALDGFRRLAVRRWRRNLLQSFHRWRSKNL